MSSAEIVRDIIVAMIERDRLFGADDVCAAYKQIMETVCNPLTS